MGEGFHPDNYIKIPPIKPITKFEILLNKHYLASFFLKIIDFHIHEKN